jgi:hypothetical protein
VNRRDFSALLGGVAATWVQRAYPRRTAEFAPGCLEAELSAIGRSVPAGEWAKVPADYFATLDHYPVRRAEEKVS